MWMMTPLWPFSIEGTSASFRAAAITEDTLEPGDVGTWWRDALHELRTVTGDHGLRVRAT
jgi:hypothetical protein